MSRKVNILKPTLVKKLNSIDSLYKGTRPQSLGIRFDSEIRRERVGPMENTILKNNMYILNGDKMEEFIEKSKNGAMKKVIDKFERLEAKKKNRVR